MRTFWIRLINLGNQWQWPAIMNVCYTDRHGVLGAMWCIHLSDVKVHTDVLMPNAVEANGCIPIHKDVGSILLNGLLCVIMQDILEMKIEYEKRHNRRHSPVQQLSVIRFWTSVRVSVPAQTLVTLPFVAFGPIIIIALVFCTFKPYWDFFRAALEFIYGVLSARGMIP